MTRGAKMFLAATSRSRPSRDGNREGRMDYAPEATRWLPPYYGVEINRYEYGPHKYGPSEPESRFRDRQGREHYDNGRFAPMRSEMGTPRRDNREPDHARNMIGFGRESEMRMGSDASMPQYHEMERMSGSHAQHGGARTQHHPRFDEQMAMEWVSQMQNSDGTTGPHWTMEQLEPIMKAKKIDLDPIEFYAAVNMIYSDYGEIIKKRNLGMDFYVDMAKAFLHDKDAGAEDKLAAYYEYVVRG